MTSTEPAGDPRHPGKPHKQPKPAIDVDRATYVAVAALSGAAIVTARLLSPSPTGQGTHQQLGLPPCTFRLFTGHDCPGCGLTTAFSHMARGHVAAAAEANPMGVVLFAVAALLLPLSAYHALRPIPVDAVVDSAIARWGMIVVLVAMVVIWVARLALGLA